MSASVGSACRIGATHRSFAAAATGFTMAGADRLVVVLVVVAHPGLAEGQGILIAPLRYQVEIVVADVQHVDSARVAGVGVEDLAAVVLVEDADAVGFLARERAD